MTDQSGTKSVPFTNEGSKDDVNIGSVDKTKEISGSEIKPDPSQPEVKEPKRRGGFLSFLLCCSAPKNDNSVELGDQAVPAKKTTRMLSPNKGRQPTPLIGKQNASAAESSNGESKENTGEGIGGPEYKEMTPAGEPKTDPQPSLEKPVVFGTPDNTSAPNPSVSNTGDAPLPPPKNGLLPSSESERDSPSKTSAAVATEPSQKIDPGESVAAQGMTINDRTPLQEANDSDIAMPDAPPVAPTAPDESTRTTQELAQTQMDLPPPPPRNGISTAIVPNAVAPTEPPKWLLPPLSPRLAGRKCLVLDLDETLVHSSFKVSISVEVNRQR